MNVNKNENNDNRPMFLMVMANNCGHCHNFKNNELQKIISRYQSREDKDKYNLRELKLALQRDGRLNSHLIDRLIQILRNNGIKNNKELDFFFTNITFIPHNGPNDHKKNFAPSEMSKLIKALQNDGNVRIRSIIIDDMRDISLGKEYHPQLKSIIGWFPTFILVSPDSWNQSGYSKPIISRTLGAVYKSDGSIDMDKSGVSLLTSTIMKAYNKELEILQNDMIHNNTSNNKIPGMKIMPKVRSSIPSHIMTRPGTPSYLLPNQNISSVSSRSSVDGEDKIIDTSIIDFTPFQIPSNGNARPIYTISPYKIK